MTIRVQVTHVEPKNDRSIRVKTVGSKCLRDGCPHDPCGACSSSYVLKPGESHEFFYVHSGQSLVVEEVIPETIPAPPPTDAA